MTKKSKQILTDTVVIINAHENGYWESLCNANHIAVPATIIENEAFYFQSDRGKVGMNPSEWVKNGKVTRIEADLEDFQSLQSKLNPDILASLDDGELEAIAILLSKRSKETRFTTADRAAIKALGVLGLSYQGISVEELLKNSGINHKGNFHQHFKKKWFQQILAEGLSEQHLWLKSPVS